MLRINNMRVRNRVIFLLVMFPLLRLSGQDVQHLDGETLSFKDRIAVRSNVVDWVLTTPNIAFDYDIVSTPYDKKTVGLGLKYNWNTSHTYIPKQVYNLFDVRLDYRFYWRQQPYDNRANVYGDWERDWIRSAKGLDKLRARANCFRAVEKPKTHISLFVGPYLSFSSFSVKLSAADDALGRQGIAFGAGLTAGVALPLYGYENGSALDLEFGGSLGWHFASYDFYAADVEHNEYPLQGHRNRFVYYPFVSDVRVSLVYRFRTISKQHTEINYDLIDRRFVALQLEKDAASAKVYNDSIRALKAVLDKRNQEIKRYKETVESAPGFIEAYSLEYLTPYMYLQNAPKKYTRDNKDTLPKIHIDSIEQITDPILLSVRKEIDSIPHVTSEQIDEEFVNQYNKLSEKDGKKVNRTELIREIYDDLNTNYVKVSNDHLVAGTFGSELHTEKYNKYNARQEREVVEITYRDSVRTVTMSANERVEWLNNIKKQAWADAQKRMQGKHAGRVAVPVVLPDYLAPDSVKADTVTVDSLVADSMAADSIDGMTIDSIAVDSITIDSVTVDSIAVDSVASDSVSSLALSDEKVEAKAQKKEARRSAKRKKEEKVANPKKVKKSTAKTERPVKAKKNKRRENKKAYPLEVMDSIKTDSVMMVDSVRTEGLMNDSVPAVDGVLPETPVAVYDIDVEQYASYSRTYFIKREDED